MFDGDARFCQNLEAKKLWWELFVAKCPVLQSSFALQLQALSQKERRTEVRDDAIIFVTRQLVH